MVPPVSCPAGYILIVDDDADLREALGEHVEMLGCTAVKARDGQDALEHLTSNRRSPCLVLLDIRMPRLDGDGFATRVREMERFANQPLVSMSAECRCLLPSANVERHLSKPFALTDITTSIAPHCRIGVVACEPGPPRT